MFIGFLVILLYLYQISENQKIINNNLKELDKEIDKLKRRRRRKGGRQ